MLETTRSGGGQSVSDPTEYRGTWIPQKWGRNESRGCPSASRWDQAFHWLSHAVEAGLNDTASRLMGRHRGSLKNDPRYAEIIKLMADKKE